MTYTVVLMFQNHLALSTVYGRLNTILCAYTCSWEAVPTLSFSYIELAKNAFCCKLLHDCFDAIPCYINVTVLLVLYYYRMFITNCYLIAQILYLSLDVFHNNYNYYYYQNKHAEDNKIFFLKNNL